MCVLDFSRVCDSRQVTLSQSSQSFSAAVNVAMSMVVPLTASLHSLRLSLQGTTIKPIVKLLKVRTEAEHKLTMNEAIHSTVSSVCAVCVSVFSNTALYCHTVCSIYTYIV